jgi:hypothetical protein
LAALCFGGALFAWRHDAVPILIGTHPFDVSVRGFVYRLLHVLPCWLFDDALPCWLFDDALPRWLFDDALPRWLFDDALPRWLFNDVLPR